MPPSPPSRCHSDALHHRHRLPKDVCALLPVPTQVQDRVPPQLHHDNAVCRTHEVAHFVLNCLIAYRSLYMHV